jgi:hypothetical protein
LQLRSRSLELLGAQGGQAVRVRVVRCVAQQLLAALELPLQLCVLLLPWLLVRLRAAGGGRSSAHGRTGQH